jgi:phosphate transport system protein
VNLEARHVFQLELDRVRSDVLRLAALGAEAIPRGTDILLRMDLAGARQLIEDDDIADALTIGIEERCDHLLTLQQPVASDLREVITALRLTADLERSIDLMVNVAKGTRRIYGTTLTPALSGLIEKMSEEAARLLRLSIDAYAERNAPLAAALGDMDDRLDELSNDYIHAVFAAHYGAGLGLQPCVQLALIGRYYERIGDHAVNIAERVQFMVTGWRPEQVGAARILVREAQAHELGIERDITARGAVRPLGQPGSRAHPGSDPTTEETR